MNRHENVVCFYRSQYQLSSTTEFKELLTYKKRIFFEFQKELIDVASCHRIVYHLQLYKTGHIAYNLTLASV